MKLYKKLCLSVCLLTLLTGCATHKSSDINASYESTQSYKNSDFGMSDAASGLSSGRTAEYTNEEEALDSELGSEYNGSGSPSVPEQSSGDIVKDYNMIIRNAVLNIDVTELDTFTDSITSKVIEYGGYFESTDIQNYESEYSTERYGNFIIRLPQEKLDSFLDEVGQSGKITSKNMTSEDVSLQYVDIEARIGSLKSERDSLNNMIKDADNIDSVLAIEQKLSEINYRLDSFERQRRALKDKVAYSTVNMTAREERNVEHPIRLALEINFKERIIDSIGNTADATVEIITALPLILIFILFITFILWVIKKLWTRVFFKNRRTAENKLKYVLMPMVNMPPEDKSTNEPEIPAAEEPENVKKEENI